METPRAAGRYRIDKLLGSGGFAAVWLGHDAELEAPVAIKILADHWAQREDVRERFVREARLLRSVDSHRLVQVFDIGELPDGRPYFVMSYADRGTLEELLAAGPLPLNDALNLAREVARGVEALHARGIVHRDLKPSNVLIRSTDGADRIMISDLGIARTDDRLSSLTLPAGSPGYMAPEQGQIDGAPDRRSDVYGLGALTYHMLTGEPPAEGKRLPSELRPTVPHNIDIVVERALDPERERRWVSAADFAQALSQTLGKVDTDPLPHTRPAQKRRAARRNRLLWAAGGVVAALMLATGGTVWALAGDDERAKRADSAPKKEHGESMGDPNGRWLRTDRGIPVQYRRLIVRAGTWCEIKGMSPALIAAMLKAESDFNPYLSDPKADEYGIARWTPTVLMYWQPGGSNNPAPRPADITPELSIPAMGRFLCSLGRQIQDVPGDPALNLAGLYRTSVDKVKKARGVPPAYRPYAQKVAQYLKEYRPS
ncbi:serine/threonine-protein kinase [Actinomadura fulvescens]|uniref:non-specific serine/threonine protein kinase n=1 Tax=Actinomadura fulvescens TaxID=46160 RepID=A0ABP6BQP0_9ACTN